MKPVVTENLEFKKTLNERGALSYNSTFVADIIRMIEGAFHRVTCIMTITLITGD